MTIPPLHGGGIGIPPFRLPVLTAPVSTGVPPLIADDDIGLPAGAPPAQPGVSRRDDAPISLAGRLDGGDVLPETTKLALALESATRAMQHGRPDQVLTALDAVWSSQLASDSPWYLRTAALQLLGRTSDAEQVLRDAIARLPRSAAMLYMLGIHTAHRGQPEAARLANDHALALHPTEPLLWLQRAALGRQGTMQESAAAILEHVLSLDPGFPAPQWLATLARLGEHGTRAPTPVMTRALERLTPSSPPVIGEQVPVAPGGASASPGVLETALRYGLTLLESPTQSARTATRAGSVADTDSRYAEFLVGPAIAPPARTDPPMWETLVLVGGVVVIALVPSLRIPALMLCGAAAMLIVSRRLR